MRFGVISLKTISQTPQWGLNARVWVRYVEFCKKHGLATDDLESHKLYKADINSQLAEARRLRRESAKALEEARRIEDSLPTREIDRVRYCD